jgi:hypothetical protein
MSPDTAPEDPPEPGPADPAATGRKDADLPVQSREDTDAGWGEQPEPDEHDRLYRDRPPHWGSE